jgi:hypothetical protein
MKLALIFLSALVTITHQQFHQQTDGMPWWSPYSYGPQQLPSMVTNHQEIYYNNFQDDIPSLRRLRPATKPLPYFTQVSELLFIHIQVANQRNLTPFRMPKYTQVFCLMAIKLI